MAANLTARRLGQLNARPEPMDIDPEWTDARVAWVVGRRNGPTTAERQRNRRLVVGAVLIGLAIAGMLAVFSWYEHYVQAEFDRAMAQTARWVR